MAIASDIRRVVPYRSQAGACSLKVPLWHGHEDGEVIQGMFRVPARLANTPAHTNERHEFDVIAQQQFRDWCSYREKRGWFYVAGTLGMYGPYDEPTARTNDPQNEDVKQYIYTARFKRTAPLFVGLDDFLETRDLAKRLEVEDEPDPMPWNVVRTKEDTGWVDPLVEAEESRKRRGIKRSDYVVPEWWPKD